MTTKMIELNLLPHEYKEKLTPASKRLGLDIPHFIPISLIGLIVFLVAISILSFLYASSARQGLAAEQKQLRDTKKLAAYSRRLEKNLPELREQDKFLTANVENKLECWLVMEQVSLCCPAKVRITEMRISHKTGIKMLTIKGSYKKGENLEMVFRMNLEKSESLKKYFGQFKEERHSVSDSGITFNIVGGKP